MPLSSVFETFDAHGLTVVILQRWSRRRPGEWIWSYVVLGGASLSGGRGGIVGTVLAVLSVGVMRNGMTQLGVQQFWIEVAQGMLLLIAVGFDQVRIRLTKSVA